MGVRLVCQP